MGRGAKIAIGIGAVALIVFLLLVSPYNSLVQLDEGVSQARANVEVTLQRRLDLIPNLVETVKGYAAHEKDTLTAVTEARAKVAGAANLQDKLSANSELTGALSRLMVVVERYPDLKASTNFRALQDQLEGTENRIAVARTRYNQSVREYNIAIRRFPTVLLAGLLGFQAKEAFEAAPDAKTAPKVKF